MSDELLVAGDRVCSLGIRLTAWMDLRRPPAYELRLYVIPIKMYLLGSLKLPEEFERMLGVPLEATDHFARLLQKAAGIHYAQICSYTPDSTLSNMHVVAHHPSFEQIIPGSIPPRWLLKATREGEWVFEEYKPNPIEDLERYIERVKNASGFSQLDPDYAQTLARVCYQLASGKADFQGGEDSEVID